MADSGKDEAGDTALEGLKESQFSVLQGEEEVTLAKFDAIRSGDGVNMLRIKTQSIEGGEAIARRGIRSWRGRAEGHQKNNDSKADAHIVSVVSFGMSGQGNQNARVEGSKIE